MRSASRVSPLVLGLGFVAGFLAVPIFHQGLFAVLHLGGIIPVPAYDMTRTAPFGVPAVVSSSFWGGVWGVLFVLTVPRLFRGGTYWVASFVLGAAALTAVYALVVAPLKTGTLPAPLVPVLVVGGLLNGAWGIGTALLLALFDRLRDSARTS